jgi:hypothetical protein
MEDNPTLHSHWSPCGTPHDQHGTSGRGEWRQEPVGLFFQPWLEKGHKPVLLADPPSDLSGQRATGIVPAGWAYKPSDD